MIAEIEVAEPAVSGSRLVIEGFPERRQGIFARGVAVYFRQPLLIFRDVFS